MRKRSGEHHASDSNADALSIIAYRHRLLCDVGSIHGFFPDLASHHDRLGFHS
jgi:hypothetical protein